MAGATALAIVQSCKKCTSLDEGIVLTPFLHKGVAGG